MLGLKLNHVNKMGPRYILNPRISGISYQSVAIHTEYDSDLSGSVKVMNVTFASGGHPENMQIRYVPTLGITGNFL